MKPTMVEVNSFHEPTGRKVVRGWDIGIPGLVITEATINGTGERCWHITHERSGYGLAGGFTSPESAVACGHALADITDWTLPALTLVLDENVTRAVLTAHTLHGVDILSAGLVPVAQLVTEP